MMCLFYTVNESNNTFEVLDIIYSSMYYLEKDRFSCDFDDLSESIHPNFIPTELY